MTGVAGSDCNVQITTGRTRSSGLQPIATVLAEDGITFRTGKPVAVYRSRTQSQQLAVLPDGAHLELDQFHRRVVTRSFSEVLGHELAPGTPTRALPSKTLVFCVNHLHAHMVVDCLKQAFVAETRGWPRPRSRPKRRLNSTHRHQRPPRRRAERSRRE